MTTQQNPEVRRRAVMRYLETHGTSTSRHINESVGLSRSALNVLLRSMADDGEVSVQQRKGIKSGSNYYTAISDTPTDMVKPDAPRVNHIPGYTIHRGSDGAHPIPNQGGQSSGFRSSWARPYGSIS